MVTPDLDKITTILCVAAKWLGKDKVEKRSMSVTGQKSVSPFSTCGKETSPASECHNSRLPNQRALSQLLVLGMMIGPKKMMKVIELGGGRSNETEHADAAYFWKRRRAAEIVSLLPDERREALEILHEASKLILLPIDFKLS